MKPGHHCTFAIEGEALSSSSACGICRKHLADHDTQESEASDEAAPCSVKIFVRMDLPCRHILHSRCVDRAPNWSCVGTCEVGQPPDWAKPEDSPETLVIYGNKNCQLIKSTHRSRSSILEALREEIGDSIDQRESVTFIRDPERHLTADCTPIIAICSKGAHRKISDENSLEYDAGEGKILDLHTAEAPINTTDLSLTINQLHLQDCIVNGIVTIYAMERTISSATRSKARGKQAIFGLSSHWELPIKQTERGNAAFLSSLWVFSNLMSGSEIDGAIRDAVYLIIHTTTRFPPALRSMRLLTRGKSLQPWDSSALVQAFFEVLKDLIPLNIFENDTTRILEGSRLLFAAILDEAKKYSKQHKDAPSLLYADMLRTIDLMCIDTQDPIIVPVSTSYGLVEEGIYHACREGGILSWSRGHQP